MTNIRTLAPYLAYGLRVQLQTETPRYCTVKQASFEKPWNLRLVDGGGLTWHVPIAEVKPCFRPFSHMTKEIEHDGKKIIPAVEAARLAAPDTGANCKWSIGYDSNELVVVQGSGFDIILESNWDVCACLLEENEAVPNQFAIYELLCSLHFAPPGLDESEYVAMEEE